MEENSSFPHSYDWDVLSGLPGNFDILNFPSGKRIYSEELILRVKPHGGKQWIGNFHGVSKDYVSGIYSTPQIGKLCVVTCGEGFIIDVYDPQKVTIVPILPIIKVYPSQEFNILIFVSITEVAGFSSNEFNWIKRVSCDGIQITNISHGRIHGLAWDPSINREVKFSIQIETGELSGGACV